MIWWQASTAAIAVFRAIAPVARALAEEAIGAAERLGDLLIGSYAHHRVGHLHVLSGDPAAARRYLEEGAKIARDITARYAN